MLRKLAIGFGVLFAGLVLVYVANPLGTASIDPRARVMGFVPYRIGSDAMAPTLDKGDLAWVSTLANRFDPPVRGDLIAFRYPADPGVVILGRVVGMAGESVEIADGRVSIDGQVLREPYLGDRQPTRPYSLRMAPVAVPEGHWFILGDNRDNSHDSRFWGPLAGDQVVGKVVGTH
jgi:signal peptidase I